MKWSGIIGFNEPVEIEPGIWIEQIIKRKYRGDVIRNTRTLQSTNQVNDNVNVSKSISIIADPYAKQNFLEMRYIEYVGAKWKVSNVDIQYPRLILTIGGLYNGQ